MSHAAYEAFHSRTASVADLHFEILSNLRNNGSYPYGIPHRRKKKSISSENHTVDFVG